MEHLIKLDVSAVSYPGSGDGATECSFYVNGRYRQEYEPAGMQFSAKENVNEYMLAVGTGIGNQAGGNLSSLSFGRELKKIQEKLGKSGACIDSKLEEIVEYVNQAENVMHSLRLGRENPDTEEAAASSEEINCFACLYFSEGRAAAVSSGDGCLYLYRDGAVKSLTGNNDKVDRLLRMGIINEEQAKLLFSKLKANGGGSESEINKVKSFPVRRGDVFLLLSREVDRAIDDELKTDLMASGRDTSYIANTFAKAALEGGCEGPVTVLAARVDEVLSQEGTVVAGTLAAKSSSRRGTYLKTTRKGSAGKKLVRTIAALVLIGALAWLTVSLWNPGLFSFKKSPDRPGSYTDGLENGEEDEIGVFPEENGNMGETEDPGSEGENGAPSGEESPQEPGGLPTRYVVKAGDSLYSISVKFYGDPDKYILIVEANDIEEPDRIFPGQELIIPAVE